MDDFNAKLISLKEKWDALILGFYGWFDINRKTIQKLSFNQQERKHTY